MNKDRTYKIIENLEITDAGAEGMALGRHEGKVVFVPFSAPGDIATVKVLKEKKQFCEAVILHLHQASPIRSIPLCQHYGICGGCRWQHMLYSGQLAFKQQQVCDSIERLGKVSIEKIFPILPSKNEFAYRNKLEFTFSNRRWLTNEEIDSGAQGSDLNALGFHIPKKFDRILDIQACHLMDEKADIIRNAVKEFAQQYQWSFYDQREQNGFLRNLVIRNTSTGEWMVTVVFAHKAIPKQEMLLNYIKHNFPFVTTIISIVNTKRNDSMDGLDFEVFSGPGYISEVIGNLKYRIGPLSFFQTNSLQAKVLYDKVREFAAIEKNDIVYDLYSGAGTIALFLADAAAKVVGIEYVLNAVNDARVNAEINNIINVEFHAGDMAQIFTQTFVEDNGHPDIIITDPPRAGMHADVIDQIIKLQPKRVVYVSCNPATQARDLALLAPNFRILAIQPIDMFPHTQHVENIALLEWK